ncbi:MAG: class I SAM-dependent methyltransferase [Opitutaceae bacterium]
MKYDLAKWPEIDLAAVRAAFREVPLAEYPVLAGYDRAAIHEGLQGQGGLFLASDMAERLRLRPGMRVLDLACGAGTTSLFLAQRYGVRVCAVDESPAPDLAQRAAERGLHALIEPIVANRRNLPFEAESFDAVFCLNAFFYFGTDDLYPPYLAGFLKPGGAVVLGGPCYREELVGDEPEEFLLEFPACLAVHSPDWWRSHFAKNHRFHVLHSALHPHGALFWEDRVRFLLEEKSPAAMPVWREKMIHEMIRMLNRDRDGFVSHFVLHARRRC